MNYNTSMIATYDPGREMVVQYTRPGGGVRSVRLQARPDRGPACRCLSLFNRLAGVLAVLLK